MLHVSRSKTSRRLSWSWVFCRVTQPFLPFSFFNSTRSSLSTPKLLHSPTVASWFAPCAPQLLLLQLGAIFFANIRDIWQRQASGPTGQKLAPLAPWWPNFTKVRFIIKLVPTCEKEVTPWKPIPLEAKFCDVSEKIGPSLAWINLGLYIVKIRKIWRSFFAYRLWGQMLGLYTATIRKN